METYPPHIFEVFYFYPNPKQISKNHPGDAGNSEQPAVLSVNVESRLGRVFYPGGIPASQAEAAVPLRLQNNFSYR